jgi:peroxiredoxin
MSAAQIPQLQRTAALLEENGYAVVTLTENLTPEFQEYLSEHDLMLPIYTDPQKELEKALGQWAIPEYYVLDGEGNVRFGPLHSLAKVPAQMAMVAAERAR